MPKRTNEFQTLIKRIYDQMAESGDTVTESAMLKERDSSTEREVDILLQKQMFGVNIRIAVECRSRKYVDDIEWIDGLIGKYRDLDVQKTVAVSRTGFSKSAREKAKTNKIETLTLTEALEIDWPAEFTRLSLGTVERNDVPVETRLLLEPPINYQVDINTPLISETNDVVGTVADLARALYENSLDGINKEISNKFLSFFKKVGDFDANKVYIEITRDPDVPIYIKDNDGGKHILKLINIRIIGIFSYKQVDVEHYFLGSAQVTTGSFLEEKSQQKYSMVAVQVPNKPNQVKVSWLSSKMDNKP